MESTKMTLNWNEEEVEQFNTTLRKYGIELAIVRWFTGELVRPDIAEQSHYSDVVIYVESFVRIFMDTKFSEEELGQSALIQSLRVIAESYYLQKTEKNAKAVHSLVAALSQPEIPCGSSVFSDCFWNDALILGRLTLATDLVEGAYRGLIPLELILPTIESVNQTLYTRSGDYHTADVAAQLEVVWGNGLLDHLSDIFADSSHRWMGYVRTLRAFSFRNEITQEECGELFIQMKRMRNQIIMTIEDENS